MRGRSRAMRGPLGEVDPHQHRADEAGGIGDRHGVQLGAAQSPAPRQEPRRATGRLTGLDMLAGGELGHHAAVDGVHLDLGGHAAGQHGPDRPCTTAAAVSSQEDSMARMFISGSTPSFSCSRDPADTAAEEVRAGGCGRRRAGQE